MRTFKLILLGIILLAIVVLALANRAPVTLHLLPEGIAGIMPLSVQVPLFVLSLVSIVVGMVIGYLLEYLREYKHRKLASQKAREAVQLNREMDRMRRQSGQAEDDVLALLG